MVPRYIRNANGATENYLSARLENAMVKGASGFSRTLYGYANTTLPGMVMRVYRPGEETSAYAFRSTDSDVVSGSVFFDKVGDWKVVLVGTGSLSFTYIVRIV